MTTVGTFVQHRSRREARRRDVAAMVDARLVELGIIPRPTLRWGLEPGLRPITFEELQVRQELGEDLRVGDVVRDLEDAA
jgi:hypothetical protein